MSKLREYISFNNIESFDNLKNDLEKMGLTFKEDDDLCLLKYDKNNLEINDLLRDCRGTIINKANNRIIAFPIKGKYTNNEFFNNVSWDNCVVEESIDGTLITLYYFNDKWQISTKGTLDAKCRWSGNRYFRDIFMEVCNDIELNFEKLKHNFTYSFVLCHPDCRNVTQYKSGDLYHISSRNIDTLHECDENIGVKKPRILKLDMHNDLGVNNYDELIQVVKTIDYHTEGYMLYSKDRKYRTKIYGLEHLRIKQLKGDNPNTFVKLLEMRNKYKAGEYQADDLEEYFTYFPEHRVKYDQIEEKLDRVSKELYDYYRLEKK